MKKQIVLIICTIAILFSCKSVAQIQEPEPNGGPIIPLHEFMTYENQGIDFPANAYLKDENNDLDKYVGIWTGSSAGKTYEIHITKDIVQMRDISMDRILLKYKITNSTGIVIANTLPFNDQNSLITRGRYLSENKSFYSLLYFGFDSNCGQNGELFLRNLSLTQMSIILAPDIEVGYDCDQVAEQVFPFHARMTLTKQ